MVIGKKNIYETSKSRLHPDKGQRKGDGTTDLELFLRQLVLSDGLPMRASREKKCKKNLIIETLDLKF